MNRINTQIYDEASEWIIRHRSDDLDADAKRRFDAWLRESPNHLRAYLEMSAIWEDLPALDPTWNVGADELIARARTESNVHPLGVEKVEPEPHAVPVELLAASPEPQLHPVTAVTVPASQSALIKRLAFAAMVVLTVGISGWFYLQRNVYTTDIGEQRTIALTDGSSVELNAQTKVRIAYTDDQRTIQLLRGQALFKVAKDPNRPFIVESDATRVRAVGTQFDVYRKSAGTQVTVVEGRVAVAAPGSGVSGLSGQPRRAPDISHLTPKMGEVLLIAGQQILIAAPQLAASEQHDSAPELAAPVPNAGAVPTSSPAAGTVPTPQPANIEAATAWTQQRLIFENASLNEVAEEFNRYNHRPLIVDDPALNDFHISGSFSSTDPALLLRFLREQPGIAVTETASEIHISQQGV